MRELIIAFGLFFFIEGLLYALFPSKMKSMLKKLEIVGDSQLRTVTSDYQNFLEKSWMEELIKKYPIKIYSEVLYKIGEN